METFSVKTGLRHALARVRKRTRSPRRAAPWCPPAARAALPLAGLLMGLFAGLLTGPAPAAPEDVERRVEALLARMTLEEKVGQLNLVSNEASFRPEDVVAGRIGAAINFNDAPAIAAVQRLARRSRLKIPVLFGLDVLHGFRTVFPVPLAETATFNPVLARAASEAAAREAARSGLQWTYAPMADLSRDPRWGRMVEGSGEDPYLGSVFTAARVEGFRAGGLATTAKHFVGYGAPEGGRDYDTTLIPRTELRDIYLPPFRAAVAAGTESVMSAFNALNGVPATANPWILTEVLRQEWNFDGFVTSDWAAIHELIAHGVARDGAEAARKAILAGVDMDMMSGFYDAHLADEVRAGRVPQAVVDESVRRVLRVKFRLGLFERPDADPRAPALATPEARRVARAVARESMVLLHNRDQVLPLAAGTRSIAVVGALAAATADPMGPHASRGEAGETVSFLDGIRARAGDVAVTYAEGCDLLCTDAGGFAAAVAAARQADAVVAVMGEPRDLSGEAASRARLDFPGRQRELVEALAATGKPVVLVLMAGRPLELGSLPEAVRAILMAWYPGTEGGAALAEILFGDVNPSGRLPVTYLRTAGQAPLAYNRLPSGRPTRSDNRFTLNYVDEKVEPQFPFGWGLSYTSFAYSGLAVPTPAVASSGEVEVTVTVTNTGKRAGQEVAQLYVRQPVASRSRPVRELKAFEKVALEPGQSRLVRFRVPARDLGYHLEDGTYLVEAGAYRVGVGGNAAVDLAGAFQVTTELRLRPGREP